MITEQYVSLEIAVLLKDKGFNETCRAYWGGFNNKPLGLSECNRGRAFDYCTNSSLKAYSDIEQTYIAAPTHQMTLEWLRKTSWLNTYNLYDKWSNKWKCVIVSMDNREIIKDNIALEISGFTSYEEATEAAILYCLKYLIK